MKQKNSFYIGQKIAPEIVKRNKISPDGDLKDVSTQVHGRKIPLKKIRNQMNKDQCDLFSSRQTTNSTSKTLALSQRHLKSQLCDLYGIHAL